MRKKLLEKFPIIPVKVVWTIAIDNPRLNDLSKKEIH